jgi:hypothetical protein
MSELFRPTPMPGCRNLFLYDCNPGSPLHWAYKVFIRKIEAKTGEPLSRPEMYASMLLNPADNREHLAPDYISDVLEQLPSRQQARFRDGLWVKGEGCVYEKFTEEMILDPREVRGGEKANNSVEAGIDYIIAKIERGEFFVSREATGVLSEIWDYSRDEDDKIVKVNDHFMDAMRYGVFSAASSGIVMT